MPIVEIAPSDSPFSQGDILKGITLYETAQSWDQGGEAGRLDVEYSLIISRPCVCAHKTRVIVAAVQKYRSDPPNDLNKLEQVLRFLTAARDGYRSTDLFYLGVLPGETGRWAARLDSLHLIEVPRNEPQRGDFAREIRVAKLTNDFARDLHLRILGAFSSLGFDDVGWFVDEDLEWVVNEGNRIVHEKSAEVLARQSEVDRAAFGDRQASLKELEKAQKAQASAEAEVEPYARELAARKQAPPLG